MKHEIRLKIFAWLLFFVGMGLLVTHGKTEFKSMDEFDFLMTIIGVMCFFGSVMIYNIIIAKKGREFVSASCAGKHCSICGSPATHKVGEEIPSDDPYPYRHNLTAYVCCACFRKIMGPLHPLHCRDSQ